MFMAMGILVSKKWYSIIEEIKSDNFILEVGHVGILNLLEMKVSCYDSNGIP